MTDDSAKQRISFNDGTVTVSYDPRKWGSPETDKNGTVSLDRIGDGFAAVVAERVGVPAALAAESVVEDTKKKHPDAEILCRETRIVNGQEVWCLKFSFVASGLTMILYTYCYAGLSGTVQVRTCATSAGFEECEPDFDEFLNSLEIRPPKHPFIARLRQEFGIAGRVVGLAVPALGAALFKLGGHMDWSSALLWTAALAAGVFLAAFVYILVKWKLQ